MHVLPEPTDELHGSPLAQGFSQRPSSMCKQVFPSGEGFQPAPEQIHAWFEHCPFTPADSMHWFPLFSDVRQGSVSQGLRHEWQDCRSVVAVHKGPPHSHVYTPHLNISSASVVEVEGAIVGAVIAVPPLWLLVLIGR